MIKLVSSFKPGRYVRRQIVCQGMWVGLARVRRSHTPTAQPMAFYKHDAHRDPQKVSYNPVTREMRFTNNNGAAVTFTLMK